MKIYIILLLAFLSCAKLPYKEDASYQMSSTLWFQNAAEVKALDYQAFNSAMATLNRYSLTKKREKPLAIVLDIDETILDNSPYQAYNILNSQTYTEKSWGEWINMRTAQALPGVSDFINFAVKRKVEVFLVSNRSIKFLADTYNNLKDKGINIKRQNIFLKTVSSSKLSRRKEIERKFKIILLIGDTLADFHQDFEEASAKERGLLIEKYRSEFGRKYIILPNPMYGDWKSSLYQYDKSKSESQKHRIHLKHLYPYK